MKPRCFQIQPQDNVATMIDDAMAGPVDIIGAAGGEIPAGEKIPRAHKIALRDIAAGEAVVKYGSRIGCASRAILRGEWVHLHNLKSGVDERSGAFDLDLGTPADTASAYV